MRSETDFAHAIDCRFPYEETAVAQALIDEACGISANAAFMVIEELARRPHGSAVPDAICLDLLARIGAGFRHPLKDLVIGIAQQMIRNGGVDAKTCSAAMQEAGRWPGQFAALSILYESFNPDVSGEDDRLFTVLDRERAGILDMWKRQS